MGFSQTKQKRKRDFDSKAGVINQFLADDPENLSIDAQLARAQKIRSVAKKKKYVVSTSEAKFVQDLFLPPIHKWDPAYKAAVTSLPILFNCWVDKPPEINDYMIPGLRKHGKQNRSGEPLTRLDHILLK